MAGRHGGDAMTFQELMRIARTAAATASGDDLEAATRAVVTALRDEAEGYVTSLGVRGMFDRILASDGEVKAAGGSAREDERALQPGFTTPAAAPDDVCEWTQEGWEYRRTGCDGRSYHIYNPKYGRPGNKCPECKRPVHLKSEAAR